ncbi:helix-turn-helix domain-containing protein [Paraburkholderia sp. SIMBA_054]|uniref:helix-turn-helix domain-containing protein n=1 Tax=Paraburkholderia sp. SIMBA_054 TaxID=3085795 RepID=UPI00397D7F89
MTPADFSHALARLGWTQTSFAEYAGYTRKTVSWWTTGKSPVPTLVARHMDLLLAIRDRLPD